MNMYKRLTTYLIASISCLLSVQAQTSFLFDNNMAVFYPADFDSTQTLPSFAITKNLLYQNDVPETWEIREKAAKGASPLGTPLREGPVRPLPAMAAGGCDNGSNWSRAPGKCRQTGG